MSLCWLYIQVGTTISSNVETSGRSSAHSNAYDALNSIQDCTAPAATQLRTAAAAPQPPQTTTPSDLFQADSPLTDHSKIKEVLNDRGWEGLASFIFGPDWFSIPLEGEDNDNTDESNVAASKGGTTSLAAGGGGKEKQSNGKATITKAPGGKGLTNNSGGKGKQLSNMAGNPNNAAANENNNTRKRSVSFSVDRQSSSITTDGGGMMDDGTNMINDIGSLNNDAVILGRWHAPYLKDIPTFPITGLNPEDIANPHRLPGSQISLSMHDYATEMEACRESTTTAALKRRGSSSDAAQSATAKAKKLQIDMAEKAMIMALRIPDDVYAKKDMVWGAIKDSNADDDTPMPDADSKKSTGEKKLNSGKATTTAKVMFDPSTKQSQSESSLNELSGPQIHRPSYVPNFLPPFPTNEYSDLANERLAASISTTSVMGDVMSRMHHRKEKRKASGISSSTSADDNNQKKKKINSSERDSVRRSVIGLGKKSVGTSYWGSSNWLDDDNAEAGGQGGGVHTKSNNIGLSDVSGASVEEGGNTVAAAASPKKSNSDVQPLVRASGSRLSKILEGSMI